MRFRPLHALSLLACAMVTLWPGSALASEGHAGAHMSPLLVLPFAGLLLCIAVLPLVIPHWWEHNRNKGIVAALFGVPMAIYLLTTNWHALVHSLFEYMDFIILLGSLFVISGGIFLKGDIKATPRNNLLFLSLGSVLASFIGTTGAAMLLIRPLLRTNSERKNTRHIPIFFIFTVANMGGMLTPLGDPPLFLGFLRGVPFAWTFKLWLEWAVGLLIVLTIFFVIDSRAYKKENPEDIRYDATHVVPLRVSGAVNFLLLGGVILCVLFLPGILRAPDNHIGIPLRELGMVGLGLLSYFAGPKKPRADNQFSFHAITEVAVLFVGIFVAMVPALLILEAKGPDLPLHRPWHFFWATGMLSSFLDNAPTYLTFTSVASGYLGTDAMNLHTLIAFPGSEGKPSGEDILAAISVGAVFMGANTYIGNGPNFMVKAISDEVGLKTPSFFGYMAWSGAILIPTFVLITFLFFR
ncbi:MAG: sodium:proton antiporter [Pseudomonadota bacterium]